MNKTRSVLLSFAAAGLLPVGCTMVPSYTRPTAPVPDAWPDGPAYAGAASATNTSAAASLSWEVFFTDAKLRRVIGLALDNNLDLRAAALNVELARAQYGIQRANLLPALDATGTESRQRTPADLSSTGHRRTSNRYDANLGLAAWEIDFFGRIRSLKDQALHEYLASDHARRAAKVLLISSVAQTYLSLAADRESLALSQATLRSQEDAYALIARRQETGLLATALDLHRAQAQVDSARADVATFTQRAAQSENALNLLAGTPVPPDLQPSSLDNVVPPADVRPDIPSDALLLRPDVAQAESLLKAANANIGAARAAFFPRVTLTAAYGTASSGLSGLFEPGSAAWTFAPQVVTPVFDARTWSAFKATKAQREITVAQYQKAVQDAFREVADALAVRGTVTDQLDAQQSLVGAVAETHRLSIARYEKGIDSYLSVLDAQRSLYAAQQQLIAFRLVRQTNLVQLYAVLGGGADVAKDADEKPPDATPMAPLLATP